MMMNYSMLPPLKIHDPQAAEKWEHLKEGGLVTAWQLAKSEEVYMAMLLTVIDEKAREVLTFS